jgi:hypothetical protein
LLLIVLTFLSISTMVSVCYHLCMDTPRNPTQARLIHEKTAMVADSIVAMYKKIETAQQLEHTEAQLISKALDGVKYELFPQLHATEEGKRQIAALINDYQADRFVIMRLIIGPWVGYAVAAPLMSTTVDLEKSTAL